MDEQEIRARLGAYVSELCAISGLEPKSDDLDNASLRFRAFQLGINYGVFVAGRKRGVSVSGPVLEDEDIRALRTSLDGLGMGRDVKVKRAYSAEERRKLGMWTDAQIEVVASGYVREREIFAKHFPEFVQTED